MYNIPDNLEYNIKQNNIDEINNEQDNCFVENINKENEAKEYIEDFAKENGIDFAVVAPDDPLVLGCVDALEEKGIPCFGPRANAAIIEGSKVFSKNLMKKYHSRKKSLNQVKNLNSLTMNKESLKL